MKVTGYQIRELLKIKHIELETLNGMYSDSLFKYVDEEKESPFSIMKRVLELEIVISLLQTAQKYYNLNVTFNVKTKECDFGDISLEYAVKLLGGYTRYTKKFSDFSKGEKRDRYHVDEPQRKSKDDEYQISTMTKEQASKEAIKSQLILSALSTAISKGNATEMDIDFLPDLS